jgi:hypothetical protein
MILSELDHKERYFTPPEVWCGGSYELKIALGRADDHRLFVALRAIWSSPSLHGCYTKRNCEPWDQVQIPFENAENPFSLYGLAHISDRLLPCTTYVVQEKDQSGNRIGDFVGLWIPMAALSKVFTVGTFPFGDADKAAEWRPIADSALVTIGKSVFDVVPFTVALIGWEPQDGTLRWYPPNRHDLIHLRDRQP